MEDIRVAFPEGKGRGSECVTWGIPWAEGTTKDVSGCSLKGESGDAYELQSKANALWPDGSVKWSLHSANLDGSKSEAFFVALGGNKPSDKMCEENDDRIIVNTGSIYAEFLKSGSKVINKIVKGGTLVCSGARLEAIIEKRVDNARIENRFIGCVDTCRLEENGSVRSVIKITGSHLSDTTTRKIFPFTLRLYFYRNSDEVKISHTFVYDGDADKDFIKGLGLSFDVPMKGRSYNRHVKIAGDNGFFHEALQLLVSWRPKLEPEIYENQMDGRLIDFCYEGPNEANQIAVKGITTWDNFKIFQDSSEHYVIRKKTESNSCAYIDAVHGGRAKGVAYLGNHKNGLAVGMRNFWQKYPSAFHINNASKDTAVITAWLWAPDAEGADLRHYDIVAHADAYYEGFDEIRSTPYGIANTNEICLRCFTNGIAENSELDKFAETVCNPPVMFCTPEYMHSVGAFGIWGEVSKDNEEKAWFEDRLDDAVEYYKKEIEQRKWYGFFHYGDFMHTYDNVRHTWRYDMGGFAWQNTELVPTLWLWLAFIRSGRSDIYTLAEAMSRHTSEVDVYHIGPYKGLGSRHNVIHWGCACKEARIAMAGHHRYFYYLTGDERTGDILDEVSDAEYGIERLDPLRYFYEDDMITHARTGPDWSSLCSNWLAAWERHGNTVCRDKLLKGLEGIKKAPLKLISGSNFGFDPHTGEMIYIGENSAGGSHLTICMGAPSVWMELAEVLKDREWNQMLADYGDFYFISPEEKEARSGGLVSSKGWSFPYMAASMMAYYAYDKKDEQRGREVWQILKDAWESFGFRKQQVQDFSTIFVKEEIVGISTNFMAQWCLNTIMCLGML